MKEKNRRLFFAALFLFVVALIYLYSLYTETMKKEGRAKEYAIKQEAVLLKNTLKRAIDDKEKAINAIALALLFDSNVSRRVAQKELPSNYAQNLTDLLRRFSNYKNIWLQFYDAQGNILYRSWIKQRNKIIKREKNPKRYFKHQMLVNYIDVDSYDLCINSLVKLEDKEGNYIGALNVKAHFNSISKMLTSYGTDSLVVVDNRFYSRLSKPFANSFIDKYYIANLDAKKENITFLQAHDIANFMKRGYSIYDNMLILSYPLKNLQGEIVAYYILFKDLSKIVSKFENNTYISLMKITFITLFLVILAIFAYEFYLGRYQKRYYKSIIDNSRNIIIITDGRRIVDVNKKFFEFFGVDSLAEFTAKNERCLYEYIVKEKGCLDIDKVGGDWFKYVMKYPHEKHKIKLEVNGSTYYFLVNVSKIEVDEMLYSIVMADITAEESYRLELEKTVVTDPLTGVRNRRFFREKIKEEILLAQRYGRPFSLILMDIDHFKQINDKFGHDVGDKVLVEFTSLIERQIREPDVFCRVGGEEFAIILPETTLNNAVHIAKKINKIVRENPNATIPVTVSLGVVEYIQGESKADIYKRADSALYKAKVSGRDRVVVG